MRDEPHNELCTLGVLLGDLLGLDGVGVLTAKGQLGDGHIVQHDVEVVCPLRQDAPDVPADNLCHANFSALEPVRNLRSILPLQADLTLTSRMVISWLALYCAMTLLRVSWTEGKQGSRRRQARDCKLDLPS